VSSEDKSRDHGRSRAGGRAPRGRARGAARVSPRKAPRQDRSREMVEAILQGAAEVFSEQGYARATTNRIAGRAGVSVGSLYQYFPNKDSLLLALYQRHHAEVHRVVEAALDRLARRSTPLQAGLRGLMADLAALHRRNPALSRALSLGVLQQSPAFAELDRHDDRDQLQQVVRVLQGRPDVRRGNHLAMALVLGQAAGQLCRWLVHDPPPGAAQGTLLDEVVALLYRYLTADPGRPLTA